MLQTKSIYLSTIIVMVCIIFACEGPAGPEGPQGTQGEQGPQGPQGEEGTANVIYSEWMDADWNHLDEPDHKIMQVPIDELDQDVLRDDTLVMVYATNYGTSSIYSLPTSGRWPEDEILYSFTFGDRQDDDAGLLISVQSLDGSELTEFEYTAFRGNRYRYVLIPGGPPAKLSEDFFKDYQAVKEYYGLDD